MTKTSIGNALVGLEWDYKGKISIFKGQGYQGGVSRTMFLSPKPSELKDMPEELFVVKISQSKNPERAGKPLFRFFTFRASAEDKYTDTVPNGIDQSTPLSEIKAMVVESLGSREEMDISIRIPLHGTFTIINLADGAFDIYNEEKFKSNDIMEKGEPPYYLRNDVDVTVSLKGAENLGNDYLQSRISSSLTADEVFQKKAASKVWGEDDTSATTYDATSEKSKEDDVW